MHILCLYIEELRKDVYGMTRKDKKFSFMLSEDNFEAQMKETVEPYLDSCRKAVELLTAAGLQHVELYRTEPSKGTVVISYRCV